jgi:hypothetical protein
MTENQSSSRGYLIPLLALALLCMIGFNIYLLYNKNQQTQVIEKQGETITYQDSLATQLEQQYNQALQELESQRTQNAELNGMIDQQKAELTKSKNDIAKLLNGDRSALAKAESKIKSIQAQLNGYLTEIAELKRQNQTLGENNTRLTEEVSIRTQEVTAQRDSNRQLASLVEEERKTSAQIKQEKAEIEEKAKELAKKVDVGSVLRVSNVVATPMRDKRNGDEDDVSRARRTDKIKVCFKVVENDVTKQGENYFIARIINPRGETLFLESMGSGTFKDEKGTEVRFTTFKTFEYNNDDPEICMYWKQDQAFDKGDYKVEVYNKGYKVGETTLKLK